LLIEQGYPTEVINEEVFSSGLHRSLSHRVFNKIVGKPPTYWRFNREIVTASARFRPEFVLILLTALHINPATLNAIHSQNSAIVANYCLDDFFSLNPKAVSRDLYRCIPLWDFIFTTKRYNVAELEAAGAKRAVFVRCGYDPAVHHPVSVSPQEQAEWSSDLLFVGTYEHVRAEWLTALVEHVPCNLRVFGNRWGAVGLHSPLFPHLQGRPLVGREKRLAFASTKIGLAFLRKANRDTYTDRSFEIPACGAFMLAER
jgi:hypothetical protein